MNILIPYLVISTISAIVIFIIVKDEVDLSNPIDALSFIPMGLMWPIMIPIAIYYHIGEEKEKKVQLERDARNERDYIRNWLNKEGL